MAKLLIFLSIKNNMILKYIALFFCSIQLSAD